MEDGKTRQLRDFLRARLGGLLGFPDEDGQIAGYVLRLNSSQEVLDYLRGLVGDEKLEGKEGRALVSELFKRRGLEMPVVAPARAVDEDMHVFETGIRATREEQVEQARRLKGRGLTVKHVKSLRRGGRNGGAGAEEKKKENGNEQKAKKNRRECGCMATRHALFANCTACGRVACEKEGRGECFFCESFVSKSGTRVSDAFVALMAEDALGGTADAKAAAAAAAEKDEEAGLRQALARRNELLARKGQSKGVIDDQGDYFEMASNKWLDEEERAKAARKAETDRRREETSRASRPVRLSLAFGQGAAAAGAEVHDSTDAENGLAYTEDYRLVARAPPPASASAAGAAGAGAGTGTGTGRYHNDTLSGRAREVYASLRASLAHSRAAAESARGAAPREGPSRVQHDPAADDDDDHDGGGGDNGAAAEAEAELRARANLVDYSEVMDADADGGGDGGVCLSMHQPWASLLVLGVKRFEGRSWPTRHRGRLWIASAAKEADPDTVAEVERQCRETYGPGVPFPDSYPVSALLGCVTLDACLSQDEFQERRRALLAAGHSVEDSESAFLFQTSRPRRLAVPVEVKGEHKLWRLPKERHASARLSLVPVTVSGWDPRAPPSYESGSA